MNLFRIRDIVVSAAGILILLPLLLIVAIAIRLDSPGPALFRQERVGLNGETFRIRKFRSMRIHAQGLAVSTSDDPRVTRVGRLIRASKVDELPQLLDVFTGTMSLVGPRPEVPKYVRLWPAEQRQLILSVRPGITDPASIVFRHEADLLANSADPERTYVTEVLPRKTALYAKYVTERSFLGDFRIIFRTLSALVPDRS